VADQFDDRVKEALVVFFVLADFSAELGPVKTVLDRVICGFKLLADRSVHVQQSAVVVGDPFQFFSKMLLFNQQRSTRGKSAAACFFINFRFLVLLFEQVRAIVEHRVDELSSKVTVNKPLEPFREPILADH
jgi:hypothetical protein